jgi:hypothetical protein
MLYKCTTPKEILKNVALVTGLRKRNSITGNNWRNK